MKKQLNTTNILDNTGVLNGVIQNALINLNNFYDAEEVYEHLKNIDIFQEDMDFVRRSISQYFSFDDDLYVSQIKPRINAFITNLIKL